MDSDWCFISTRLIRSKNRMTPPPEVREKVETNHAIDGPCVWWHYDPETGFALISNKHNEDDYIALGRSKFDSNNVVVVDSGLIDAAFESVSEGDCLVFLGVDDLLSGEENHLYLLHETQLFDLLEPL